jgi:uncharacterized tellurite resistance protein B-like protein
MIMLKTISQFIDELISGADRKPEFTEDEARLAAAALLVHACRIDGTVEEAETRRLHDVLKERYKLNEEDLHTLIVTAERRERDAIDLYGFTSKLKHALSEEERIGLIEMMWQIAYANGKVHAFEDNLIWRTAELLGVSSRARIAARKKVEAQQAP